MKTMGKKGGVECNAAQREGNLTYKTRARAYPVIHWWTIKIKGTARRRRCPRVKTFQRDTGHEAQLLDSSLTTLFPSRVVLSSPLLICTSLTCRCHHRTRRLASGALSFWD